MGDWATDTIEGRSCSHCGIYFVKSHGHPVACKSCWAEDTPEEREATGLQKARHPEA